MNLRKRLVDLERRLHHGPQLPTHLRPLQPADGTSWSDRLRHLSGEQLDELAEAVGANDPASRCRIAIMSDEELGL